MAVLFPLAMPIQRNFVCVLKLLLQGYFELLFLFCDQYSFWFCYYGRPFFRRDEVGTATFVR